MKGANLFCNNSIYIYTFSILGKIITKKIRSRFGIKISEKKNTNNKNPEAVFSSVVRYSFFVMKKKIDRVEPLNSKHADETSTQLLKTISTTYCL